MLLDSCVGGLVGALGLAFARICILRPGLQPRSEPCWGPAGPSAWSRTPRASRQHRQHVDAHRKSCQPLRRGCRQQPNYVCGSPSSSCAYSQSTLDCSRPALSSMGPSPRLRGHFGSSPAAAEPRCQSSGSALSLGNSPATTAADGLLRHVGCSLADSAAWAYRSSPVAPQKQCHQLRATMSRQQPHLAQHPHAAGSSSRGGLCSVAYNIFCPLTSVCFMGNLFSMTLTLRARCVCSSAQRSARPPGTTRQSPVRRLCSCLSPAADPDVHICLRNPAPVLWCRLGCCPSCRAVHRPAKLHVRATLFSSAGAHHLAH